jgi:glutamine---fructose-6-phosphate transaminase (isomerizing)
VAEVRADYAQAVAAQPENLGVAYRSVSAALDGMALPRWKPGETVGVVAMGASTHSANALVYALCSSGIRGVNLTASDLALYPTDFQPADHYVIVSESGRSPEPIAASKRFTPGRRAVITNAPHSPITRVVDYVIPLGGFLDSGVYTIGYTATLMAYALLLDAAGVPGWASQVDRLPERVAEAIDDHSSIVRHIAGQISGVEAVDFVGRGMSFAAAAEGALVFREALGLPTAAFETYQYLHGPMEGAHRNTGLIVFGDERELSLIDSVVDTGTKVVLVTAADPSHSDHENLTVVQLPAHFAGFGRAVVETVIMQLVAGSIANLRGLSIGEFTYRQSDTKLPLGT